MHNNVLRTGSWLLLVGTLVSCASVKVNEPLKEWDPNTGYRYTSQSVSKVGSEHTIWGLSFFGGGTRAAAFAYGVLEELADTRVTIDGGSHRLDVGIFAALSLLLVVGCGEIRLGRDACWAWPQ